MNRFHSPPQNKTSPITHHPPQPPFHSTQCPPKSPSASSPTPTTTTNHHHPIQWKRFLDAFPPYPSTPSTPAPPVLPTHYAIFLVPLPNTPRAGSPFRQTSLPTQCHPTVVLPVRSYTVIRSLTMPVNRPQWAEQLTRDTWGALVKKTCEECHWKEGWIGTLFRRGWILFGATNPTRITATSGFRGMVLRIE